MPEGAYLKLANMLQAFHDKPKSDSGVRQMWILDLSQKDGFSTEEGGDWERAIADVTDIASGVDGGHAVKLLSSVTHLIKLLSCNSDDFKEKSAAALGHIANHRGTIGPLVELGVVQPLVSLLSSTSETLKEQVLFALSNIAVISVGTNKILSTNATSQLIAMLSNGTPEVQKRALLVLKHMVCSDNSDATKKVLVDMGLVRSLLDFLTSESLDMQEYVLDTLNFLDLYDSIEAHGGIPPLVDILHTGSPSAKYDAANIINMMLYKSKYTTQKAIISAGGVKRLVQMLKSDSQFEKESSLPALAEFTTCLPSTLDTIMRHKCVNDLVSVLRDGEDKFVKFDAVKILHAVAVRRGVLDQVVDAGGIPALLDLLTNLEEDDDPVKAVALLSMMALRANLQTKLVDAGAIRRFSWLLNSQETPKKAKKRRFLGRRNLRRR